MAVLSTRSILYICITVIIVIVIIIWAFFRQPNKVSINTSDGTFEFEPSSAKEMAMNQLNDKTTTWGNEIDTINNLIKKGGLNEETLNSLESLRDTRQSEINQAISFLGELTRFKDMNGTEQEDLLSKIFLFLDPEHNMNVDADFGIIAKELNTNFRIDTLIYAITVLRSQLSNSNNLIAQMSQKINELEAENNTYQVENKHLQELLDAAIAQQQKNIDQIASMIDTPNNESDNSLVDSLNQANTRLNELQNQLNSFLPFQIQNLTFTAPKAATNKQGGFKTHQVKNLEVNFKVVSNQLKKGETKIKLYYTLPNPNDKIGNSTIIDSTHTKTITLGENVQDIYKNFDFVPGLYTVVIKILNNGNYQTLGIISLTIKVPNEENIKLN